MSEVKVELRNSFGLQDLGSLENPVFVGIADAIDIELLSQGRDVGSPIEGYRLTPYLLVGHNLQIVGARLVSLAVDNGGYMAQQVHFDVVQEESNWYLRADKEEDEETRAAVRRKYIMEAGFGALQKTLGKFAQDYLEYGVN